MSLIGKEIGDFSVEAYHDNSFKTISKEDVLGKWSVFFFYPADFTFVCPTELEDLADQYDEFKKAGSKFIPYRVILTSCISSGTNSRRRSKRSSILCLQIPHMYWRRTLRFS